MSLNAAEVAAVVAELAPLLAGRRAQKVHQTDAHTLALDLGGRWLLLSVAPGAARLHLLADKPAAPATPSALAMQLRKELGGARLESITVASGDRVATLRFSSG